jgi:tetratricopeptide (TPR) repeat protein
LKAAMMVGARGRSALALVWCLELAAAARAPAAWAETRSEGRSEARSADRSEARPDDRAEARAHYDKGTGAYALGRYGDAASEFEQAFALKPDPAILYNAAQANRLAGKRDRALELYRSYLRVYGRRAEHASDVEWHIGELQKAAEVERAASPAPPSAGAPLAPAPALEPGPTVSLVAEPPPAPSIPIYRRWWFWAGAGALVAGIVVGAVLASRRSPDCGAGVDYCASTGL